MPHLSSQIRKGNANPVAVLLDRHPHRVLMFIVLLAAGLRIARIPGAYPSMDEQWHLNLSTGRGTFVDLFPEQTLFVPQAVTSTRNSPAFWNVWTHLRGIMHPPFYLTVLRIWRDGLGDSDAVAVALSVLCSLVALVFCFYAARMSFGTPTAAVAGLLMAVSPVQIYLGTQIRGYGMLVAIASALLYLVVRTEILGITIRRIVLLSALLLALMLTHYFSIAVCGLAVGFLLFISPPRNRGSILVALAVAVIAYAIVWGPYFLEQKQDVGPMADSWLIARGQGASRSFARFAEVPARMFVDFPNNRWPVKVIALAFLFAAVGLSLQNRRLRIWILWLLVTPLLLLALDLKRSTMHLQMLRYASASGFVVFAVFAALCSKFPRWLGGLLVACDVLFSLMNGQANDARGSPRYDSINNFIAQSRPNDTATPIVFANAGGPPWRAKGMILDAAHDPKTRGRSVGWIQDRASDELMKQLAGKEFWVAGFPAEKNPENAFPGSDQLEWHLVPGACYVARLRASAAGDSVAPTSAPVRTP